SAAKLATSLGLAAAIRSSRLGRESRDVSWQVLYRVFQAAGRAIVRAAAFLTGSFGPYPNLKSRLKIGCSQDWPPHGNLRMLIDSAQDCLRSRPFISAGCGSPSMPNSVGAISCSAPPERSFQLWSFTRMKGTGFVV